MKKKKEVNKALVQTISHRVRVLINTTNQSLGSFARSIGMTPQCLSPMVTGKNLPSASTLILLAKELNCSTDFLLGLTNQRNYMAKAKVKKKVKTTKNK
jgi:plasmid maintenance system antidote protein VapI